MCLALKMSTNYVYSQCVEGERTAELRRLVVVLNMLALEGIRHIT